MGNYCTLKWSRSAHLNALRVECITTSDGRVFHWVNTRSMKKCFRTLWRAARESHLSLVWNPRVLEADRVTVAWQSDRTRRWTILKHSIKSKYLRLASRVGRPNRLRRSSYDKLRIPKMHLVILRWMRSISAISLARHGLHTGVAYSTIGRMTVLKIGITTDGLREWNVRSINPVSLRALAVTLMQWSETPQVFEIVTPRSRILSVGWSMHPSIV